MNPWLITSSFELPSVKSPQQDQVKPPPTLKRHHINVKNQFFFDTNDSRTACVPISIMALYCMYDVIVGLGQMLSEEDWAAVMRRGTLLWRAWKRTQTPVLVNGKDTNLFPTAHEVLTMPACKQFSLVFGREATAEYAGLAREPQFRNDITNMEGSLDQSLEKMLQLGRQASKNAYALLVLPGSVCVSLLCQLLPAGYRIFMFDSHGSKIAGTNCELLEFSDYKRVARYLLKKYAVDNIDQLSDEIAALYDEEEVVSFFSYAMTVYIK